MNDFEKQQAAIRYVDDCKTLLDKLIIMSTEAGLPSHSQLWAYVKETFLSKFDTCDKVTQAIYVQLTLCNNNDYNVKPKGDTDSV